MTNFMRLFWYLNRGLHQLHWDKSQLQTYQEKNLRAVIKQAYDCVPFYRQKFTEAGIMPSDIKTVEDLHKLPIIRKDDIRHQEPSRLIASTTNPNTLSVVRTTGSTGKPIQVFLSPKERDWRKAIYMRANLACGQKVRDRWVAVTQPSHVSSTPIQRRLGIFAQTCVSLFLSIDEQIRQVEKYRPDVLDGYSMWLYTLAKETQNRGIKTIQPRIIFGSSEFINARYIGFIESIFQAPFCDQFGCSEVNRTAWQCSKKEGYHIDVDSVVTEFVDVEGDNVSVGERGEILYTSLFNYAMPLIRYAVGDLGVPSDDECSCGVVLPLMKNVEGRTDSLIRLPNGSLLSPRIFSGAIDGFDLFNEIDEYKLVQKKVDQLRLLVVRKPSKTDKDMFSSRLTQYLAKSARLNLEEIQLDVELVDNIGVGTGGKHRAIISEVTG